MGAPQDPRTEAETLNDAPGAGAAREAAESRAAPAETAESTAMTPSDAEPPRAEPEADPAEIAATEPRSDATPPAPMAEQTPEPAADPLAAAEPLSRDDAGRIADLLGGVAVFVSRPVMAMVLSALIVVAGLAAMLGVEVRELPDIDRPVLTITTGWSGAGPETIDREVTSVIEGAAGRVAGAVSISSNSRFGRSQVTVEFSDSINLDTAATDMRDAVSRVRNSLPDEADEPRIVKADADSSAVMRLAVTSTSRSVEELSRLVDDVITDRLISAPGVADVQVFGTRNQVFRVDVNLLELASRGLNLSDVRNALRNVSYDSPAGALSGAGQNLIVRTTASVSTAVGFEALELGPGTRLGDVAQVTLGPAAGESILRANGETGIGLGILRQAQSNTLEISSGVRSAVEELNRVLPEDVGVIITSDDALFIEGAIHEVVLTLVLAVLIVIAVIYLFLLDIRATLIPSLTIPVALIGTLAAIWLVGFSVNILTLLALVLATGLVVDDAIVVLENIVRHRAMGMGPRAAAVLGTRQVVFAVVATTLTLVAVFVPISFLPGQAGGLFLEFGFTLAISVVISSLAALTMCPVLASRLLKEETAPRQGVVQRFGGWLARGYLWSLRAVLAAPLVVLAVTALFLFVSSALFVGLRQELTPPEDRSAALLSVTAPQGVSLDFTTEQIRQIEARIAPLMEAGEVQSVFAIVGQGGSASRAFVVMSLTPWSERTRSQQQIAADISARVRDVIGVRAFAIQPNSLGIRGAGQGLRFAVLGSSYDRIATQAEALVAALEQRPEFGQVRLSFERTQPQLFIEVDRRRAEDLGVNIDGLGQALQAVLDGTRVGSVFIEDRSFDILMLSTSDPVRDPGDLERIFVQASSGQMVPLSSFVSLDERPVAPDLNREMQMRSVEVTAGLTPGLSLGTAWAEVQALGEEILDPGTRLLPLAEAATLGETNAGLLTTFGFAILIVLLVLAAQFESFNSAVIVMSTVPVGLACAILALVLTGSSLNVYSQIGLVLLVGIMAKNGILIVEFANQLRDSGKSVREALLEACEIRLRPVMMTMTSTVLGGIPLIMSQGAGAEAREALGWVIVGGLGLSTIATLYLTPLAYLLLAGLSKPRATESQRLTRELAAVLIRPEKATPAE